MKSLLPAVAAVILLVVALATIAAGSYGLVLFVLLPVLLGALAVFATGPATMGQAIGKATFTILAASGLLLLVKIEGAICILMTLPLALCWHGSAPGLRSG